MKLNHFGQWLLKGGGGESNSSVWKAAFLPSSHLISCNGAEEEKRDGETEEKDHGGTAREAICVNGVHIKRQIRIRGPMKALA